ncbi:hypothetical protein DB346_02615 [Verrucomicrobia bacterium LW23]|nr:hypothetical protein DB346_04040 [Verrucomicrobia bacterium LW23]PTY04341.1 hypothetical protein DB346_02615 [Verrucomicrobia bacterium LW23]
MATIPDQFDLGVRRARLAADPDEQMEILMGALLARAEWYFLNIGTRHAPEAARVDMDDGPYLLLFTSPDKLHNLTDLRRGCREDYESPAPMPNFSIPCLKAVDYCLGLGDAALAAAPSAPGGAAVVRGLFINPGDYAFAVPMERFRQYITDWRERGGHLGQGFLIPNTSTEEDDFYQEHGL